MEISGLIRPCFKVERDFFLRTL